MYATIQQDLYILFCSFRLTVTWQVSIVGQELLTRPEHPSCADHYFSLCPVSFGHCIVCPLSMYGRGRRGRGRMVVWFTTTYAISAYHHWCCESEFRSGRGMHHYVGQWLATVPWFSPGPRVSSTNKTDRHDIAEILLKVTINTRKPTNQPTNRFAATSYYNLCICCCSVQTSTGVRNKHNKARKPYICPFFICFLVVAALTTALVYVISNKTDKNSSKEPDKLSRGKV